MLGRYRSRDDVLVVAVPRGGVPVAAVVADALEARLDVVPVRRIRLPERPALVLGATAGSRAHALDERTIEAVGVGKERLAELLASAEAAVRASELHLRGGHARARVRDRAVLLVDDGLATGTTLRAATARLRRSRPRAIVVGVPVAHRAARNELATEVDEIVCPLIPERFGAVSVWYADFREPGEAELAALLRASRR
jgi:putative phosphoribosyl transferase